MKHDQPSKPAKRQYAAFISYSHRSDKRTGPLIESALEQFPATWYRRRRRRIYLDSGDLSASDDLWRSLEEALTDSDRLILIASPESAESRWVQREVTWWLDNRSISTIIILHSKGVLDFDVEGKISTDALPAILLRNMNAEPNVIFLPPVPKRRIDPGDPQWNGVLAAVIANLDGVSKDALIGEHVQNRRRWQVLRSTTIALLAILLVISLAATAVALVQRDDAIHQQRVAIGRLLLNRAENAITDDPRLSLRLAEAAYQMSSSAENEAGLDRLFRSTRYSGTLESADDDILSSAFSPDGKALATASADGSLMLWDTSDIRKPRVAGSPVTSQNAVLTTTAFSHTGTLLATGDNGGGVVIWDVTNLAEPRPILDEQLENGDLITDLVFTPDGKALLCSLSNGKVSLWGVRSDGKSWQHETVQVFEKRVESMALSPDGRTLAVSDGESQVQLRQTSHGLPLVGSIPVASGQNTTALAFSPDALQLAVGNSTGSVATFDLRDGTTRSYGQRGEDGIESVVGIAFAPTANIIVASRRSGTTVVSDLADGHEVARTKQPAIKGSSGANSLSIDPRGSVYAVNGENGDVVLWRLEESRRPQLVSPLLASDLTDYLSVPNNQTLVVAGASGMQSIDISDTANPRPGTLQPTVEGAGISAVSANGAVVATAKLGIVLYRRDSTGHLTRRGIASPLQSVGITALAVSPDGTAMAVGNGNGTVELWDIADLDDPVQIGSPLTGYAGAINALSYGPAANTLVGASSGASYKGPGLAPPGADGVGTVIVWDIRDPGDPQASAPLVGHVGPIDAVAVSQDGLTLAYGGGNGKIFLWSIADPREPQRIGLPLPTTEVTALAFAPDNLVLAAGGTAGSLSLWDVADLSRPVVPFPAPARVLSSSVRSISISPNSNILATATIDSIALWDIGAIGQDRRNIVTASCAASAGGLSHTEWAAAVPGLAWEKTCPN